MGLETGGCTSCVDCDSLAIGLAWAGTPGFNGAWTGLGFVRGPVITLGGREGFGAGAGMYGSLVVA